MYLIDTPGFDDTARNDTDVLRDIADWLTKAYEKRIDLRGVIYLHRITDPRMQGSAMKNLFMFKKLCGPEGLKNVILATTMWENVSKEDGNRREAELRDTPDYWKTMIDKYGSHMVRHRNGSESAKRIIESLLELMQPITYAIQNEMVNQGKDLDQTSAGKELWSIKVEERERFEKQLADLERDMAEAREIQDKESQEQIRMLQEEKNREIANLQLQQEKMQISLDRLHKEKHEELQNIVEQMRSEAESSKVEQSKQCDLIGHLRKRMARVPNSVNSDPGPTSSQITAPRRQLKVYEKWDLDESERKQFSLALCGQYYCFCGPVSNFK